LFQKSTPIFEKIKKIKKIGNMEAAGIKTGCFAENNLFGTKKDFLRLY